MICIMVQTTQNITTEAAVFMYAEEFPLFDETKVIPTNIKIGVIYANKPKTPNKKEDKTTRGIIFIIK